MSAPKSKSIFLERKSYRQRRLRDGVRMLPLFGGVLCAIPVAWANSETDGISNASALQYIFGIWIVLIVLTGIVSNRLSLEKDQTGRGE